MKPDETQKTAEQAENEAIINELDAVRKHKLTDEELRAKTDEFKSHSFGILAIIFAFIFPLAGLITGLIGWQRGEKFEVYYNKTSKQKIASLIAFFIVLAQYLLQFLSALSNTI